MVDGHGVDAGKISTQLAQRAIDRLLEFAEAIVKERWAKHKNKDTSLFADYMQAQSKRCALIRTLIYDKQSAHLPDVYVPLRAAMMIGYGRGSHDRTLTTEELVRLLEKERGKKETERQTLATILVAPAGAGKTFFMRNLYIKLAQLSQSKIPIFLDARELNRSPLTDFAGVVTTAFRVAGYELSREQALDGLKAGMFIVLIDGFDELRQSHERHYASAFDSASTEYQLCPLVLSGRPSELLHTFAFFQQCNLLPLDRQGSINLINRLEFDEKTKTSFSTHPTSAVLSDAWYFAKRVTLSLALRSSGDAGRGFGRVGAAAALVAG
jgi:hypothetical protein